MHLPATLLSAAAIAAIAHAQDNVHNWVNPTNVTGSVPIPGFRMDIPYPGEWSDDYDPGSGDGWRLSINLTQEWHPNNTFMSLQYQLLPPKLGTEGALFRPSHVSYNGTNHIQTLPQWSVDNSTAKTWSMWFGYFDYSEVRTVEDGNDSINGTCPESVLGAECQREIRNAIMTLYGGSWNDGLSTPGYSSIFSELRKCDGYTKGTFLEVPLDQSFATKTGAIFGSGLAGETDYDKYGSRTYPIIAVFAQAPEIAGTRPPEVEEEHIVIACVKADTVVSGGSKLPEWDASSASGKLSLSSMLRSFLAIVTAVGICAF